MHRIQILRDVREECTVVRPSGFASPSPAPLSSPSPASSSTTTTTTTIAPTEAESEEEYPSESVPESSVGIPGPWLPVAQVECVLLHKRGGGGENTTPNSHSISFFDLMVTAGKAQTLEQQNEQQRRDHEERQREEWRNQVHTAHQRALAACRTIPCPPRERERGESSSEHALPPHVVRCTSTGRWIVKERRFWSSVYLRGDNIVLVQREPMPPPL